jgi:hypothetical protein
MPVPPQRVDLTPLEFVMSELLIGYARVSTEEQDLTAQRDGPRSASIRRGSMSIRA